MSERDGYDPGTPSWVDLSTPDLDASLRFYGELFGWEFEDAGEEAGHYHQALLRGKRVAGIGPAQPGSPPMAYWTTYFSGSDADAEAAAIRDAGGQVVMEPMEIFGQGKMLIAQDPTGAMFGIWQPMEHKGAQLVNEDGALTWNELMTRDIDAAQRFYGSVFSYEFDPIPSEDGSFDYRVLRLGSKGVGGMWQMTDEVPAETPPNWMAYFWLDDVDAGFDKVRELGGEVLREPDDSPYGRFAPVRDPQGAVFALIRGTQPDR